METLKIGEKTYELESVTNLAKQLIADIKLIDEQLQQQQLSLSVTQIAKSKLMEELNKEIPKFKEITKTSEEK